MKISEIITDKYKLRMPPTVYYELLADVVEVEEEQEPILDKIRAEISDFEEEVFNRPNTDYSDYAAVRHCLEIIDKYKAESEPQESEG